MIRGRSRHPPSIAGLTRSPVRAQARCSIRKARATPSPPNGRRPTRTDSAMRKPLSNVCGWTGRRASNKPRSVTSWLQQPLHALPMTGSSIDTLPTIQRVAFRGRIRVAPQARELAPAPIRVLSSLQDPDKRSSFGGAGPRVGQSVELHRSFFRRRRPGGKQPPFGPSDRSSTLHVDREWGRA